MDDRDYELLIRLFETKNITQAAAALYATQSAVSKRIQSMESELGAKLFVRTRKGISFTYAGELALAHARRAYDSTRQLYAAISNQNKVVMGTLNVNASINYAQFILPKVMVEYQNRYPEVNVHILTGQSRDLIKRLAQREVQLAIVRGEHAWNGKKICLCTEPMYAIVGLQHMHQELRALPYIAHKTDPVLEEEKYRWLAQEGGLPPTGKLYVDNINACVGLVESGLGWSIVPEICLGSFSGRAESLYFADGVPFERSTYLCCTEDEYEMPHVKAFADVLVHFHKESPAE